jgi:hypothetical protein
VTTATDHRERMPQCAAFVDDMRAAFGAPVRILAEENGSAIRYTAPQVRGLKVPTGLFRVCSPASEFTVGMRRR